MNYKELISYDYVETKILPNGAIAIAIRSHQLGSTIRVVKDDQIILIIKIMGNNLDIQCQPDNEELKEKIGDVICRVVSEDGKATYSTSSENVMIKTLNNLVYYTGEL